MDNKELDKLKEDMLKVIADKAKDPAYNWEVFAVKDSPAQKLLEELIRKKFLGDEKA